MERQETETVLLIRPGALGDTLMLVPLVAGLEGSVKVVAAVRRPGLDVLRARGVCCVDVEAGGWHRLFQEAPKRRPVLPPGGEPDHVIAFLRDSDRRVAGNLQALFSRAECHVFFGRPDPGSGVHAALHLARCAARAGLPVEPETCLDRAVHEPLLRGEEVGARQGVVLHPGSGGPAKNLSPGFWLALSERLSKQTRTTVLLGPAEEPLAAWFEERLSGRSTRLVVGPEPGDLLSLLGRAAWYAGHDSGVSHLAAMLGTPTLALFRTGDPVMWRPLGPEAQVLWAEEEGATLLDAVGRHAESVLSNEVPC